jgi:hypothetical protein
MSNSTISLSPFAPVPTGRRGHSIRFPDGTSPEEMERAMSEAVQPPGPWTKYQNQGHAAEQPKGPWTKYQSRGQPVTDPELIERLEAAPSAMAPNRQPVTDPELLEQLEAAPQEDSSFFRDPARSLKMGIQDVGTGLAELALTPADLLNLVINTGAAGVESVAGLAGADLDLGRLGMPSEVLSRRTGEAADALGFDRVPWEDRSTIERGLGHASRMATQFAGASGGLAKAVADPRSPISQGIQAVVPESLFAAARKGRTGQAVGSQFASDAVAGAGAGVGLSGAEEMLPDEMEGTALGGMLTALASMAGGITGAGAMAASKGGLRAGVDIAQRATGQGYERALPERVGGGHYTKAEADQAARLAQLQADDPVAAARTARENRQELLNLSGEPIARGETPTTGTISGDPGLVSHEQRARMDPQGRNQFVQQDRNVRSRALDEVGAIAPRGSDPRAFTDRAERLATAQRQQAARGVEQAQGQAEGVAKARSAAGENLLSRRGQKEPASVELDKQFRETLTAEEAQRRQMFNDPAMLRESVDPEPLVEAADAIKRQVDDLALTDPASVPQGLLSRIKSLEKVDPETGDVIGLKPLSFEAVQDARSNVAGAITRARADGNGGLAGRLIRLKAVLDQYPDELAARGNEAAKRALQNERENFAPRFRSGAAADQRKAVKSGRDTAARPSEFGDRFLRRSEDAQSLGRALNFNGNPEAVKQARAWLGGRLAESGVVGADGAIKPAALQKWRENNRGVLQAVPGAEAETAKILKQAHRGERLSADYGGNVRAAKGAAKATEQEIKYGPLGRVLGKDPVNAIESVFRSGDSERNMEALVRQVGSDRKAHDGMKAALRDYVFERKTGSAVQQTADGRRPVGWAHLDDMMTNHDRALAKVLSPDEMNRLRGAHKFLRPLKELEGRSPAGFGISTKTEIMSDQAWRLATILARVKYGILKGGGVMRTAKDAIAQIPNRNEAVRELTRELHLDPRVADHLLSRNVELMAVPEWNARLNALLGVAEGGRETYGRKPLELTIGRPAHWDQPSAAGQ